MAAFLFDQDEAMKADQGGFINAGCVAVGMITKCKSFKNDSGAGGLEFSVEDSQGRHADFIKIYTKNKDGSDNFARGKVMALMGILGLKELNAIQSKDEAGIFTFPALLNKPIAFMLQREDYHKNDGSVGYKMNLVHWFYADTLQTFVERVNNKEAVTAKHLMADSLIGNKAKEEKVGGDPWDNPPTSGSVAIDTMDDSLPY